MSREAQCAARIVLMLGALFLLHSVVALAQSPAGGQPASPGELVSQVGIGQRLGEQVPLDLVLRDSSGRRVRLGDLLQGKPVILNLVQYRCPMLCNQALNGLLRSLQSVPLQLGKDFRVITVSFDARETSGLAAEKKANYAPAYRRGGAEEGWSFLTGDDRTVAALARSLGFRYRYDEASGQFAHAAGLFVLTPEGRIGRCFYGIDYPPRELGWGLMESAKEKIGSPVEQVLLLCYHYDPTTGRYGLAIHRLVQAAGAATVLLLGGYIATSLLRERRRRSTAAAAPAPPGPPE